MNHPQNRQKFLEQYPFYSKSLVLNDSLKKSIKNFHPTLWGSIETSPEDVIKSYILMEFTQDRYSCLEIIRMLRESKDEMNIILAEGLNQLNTTPGRKSFDNRIDIEVTPVLPTEIRLPNTVNYPMTKNPRGKAIIINNFSDLVSESERFVHIFENLMFKVEDHYKWTAKQMIEKFTKLSKEILERFEEQNERDDALIIMVITHGEGDNLLGINHPSCGGTDDTDLVSSHKIVDLFSKIENTPKIFFFNCRREVNGDNENPKKKNYILKNESEPNTDTYVYYACAEGFETQFKSWEYTLYGKLLSESFAQYAHSDDLVQIINRTNQAIRNFEKNEELFEIKGLPYRRPENARKGSTRKLYFNPGWYEGKNME